MSAFIVGLCYSCCFAYGTITVNSPIAEYKIEIDNNITGYGIVVSTIEAGNHSIIVKYPGDHIIYKDEFIINNGDDKAINIPKASNNQLGSQEASKPIPITDVDLFSQKPSSKTRANVEVQISGSIIGKDIIKISLNIYNKNKYAVKIDPNNFYMKDTDRTLLMTLSPDEVAKSLDNANRSENEAKIAEIDAQIRSLQSIVDQNEYGYQQEVANKSNDIPKKQYVSSKDIYGNVTIKEEEQRDYGGIVGAALEGIRQQDQERNISAYHNAANMGRMKISYLEGQKQSLIMSLSKSDNSSIAQSYFNKPVILPPNTRIKRDLYISTANAYPPYKASIKINKQLFNYSINY